MQLIGAAPRFRPSMIFPPLALRGNHRHHTARRPTQLLGQCAEVHLLFTSPHNHISYRLLLAESSGLPHVRFWPVPDVLVTISLPELLLLGKVLPT
jgi:hypothetical protein